MTSGTQSFDAIVIGAGVMGSGAAYHLAKDGQRTLLLEQFEIGHTRGSSHGESRIFRFAYNNPAYAKLAMQTKPLWKALEAEAGEQLLIETGGLDLTDEPAAHKEVRVVAEALSQVGGRFEELDAAAIRRRYPQWRLGDDTIAVFSPDAGILKATRCVQVMVEQAAKLGASVKEDEPVEQIVPDTNETEILTAKGRYRAKKLIVTGGAWINSLLTHLSFQLPLAVTQEQVAYFRPAADMSRFAPDHFPIFIHWGTRENRYGFPITAKPGIKVGLHHDGPVIDVNRYTQQPREEVTVRTLNYVRRYLPDAAGEAFEPTTCLYTSTPDHDFVIDFAPGLPNVVFCSACSGHGFKFGIGIGRALADLVEHGATAMNISHLQMRVFAV